MPLLKSGEVRERLSQKETKPFRFYRPNNSPGSARQYARNSFVLFTSRRDLHKFRGAADHQRYGTRINRDENQQFEEDTGGEGKARRGALRPPAEGTCRGG